MKPYKYQKELDLYNEAVIAAAEAANKMITENGEQWYPCGFAWVKIKPARGRFVSMLKDMNIGRTDTFGGGYSIWNPSGHHTQWMDAKYAGAKAFAEVLKKNGIQATACERMD